MFQYKIRSSVLPSETLPPCHSSPPKPLQVKEQFIGLMGIIVLQIFWNHSLHGVF